MVGGGSDAFLRHIPGTLVLNRSWAGVVAGGQVVKDGRTKKSKGYGFASFLDATDFAKAIREMDGTATNRDYQYGSGAEQDMGSTFQNFPLWRKPLQ